jgi:hypothetical protein
MQESTSLNLNGGVVFKSVALHKLRVTVTKDEATRASFSQ